MAVLVNLHISTQPKYLQQIYLNFELVKESSKSKFILTTATKKIPNELILKITIIYTYSKHHTRT